MRFLTLRKVFDADMSKVYESNMVALLQIRCPTSLHAALAKAAFAVVNPLGLQDASHAAHFWKCWAACTACYACIAG